jgi:two-component system sensor histidine kinase KdpD
MAPEIRRPDPDALLARVAEEGASGRGGRLKVFLGAAPGVGKTFAMLNAARELAGRGIDVVVGLVETHGRRETEALLEGLEVVPRRRFDYKGRELEEMDLDALLTRRPAVALVDELAHTNVPGSRHERRHQDVAELLDAGIDVFTTVNVQHLESLNDLVEQLTGVRVRETVPDAFLDRLEEIVLVDLPPRELIERLRQGKVYVPERARAALERYFSPSNLAALRELALQVAADRVDADLREHLAARAEDPGVGIRPRLLVAVDGHEHTEYLVRTARRMAERRQMPWAVAYVETGSLRSRTDTASLDAAFQLARRLGGETITLRGDDVADELLAFARKHAVTALLVGRTRERPIARLFRRTITQRLLDRGAHLELTIVNTPVARRRSRRRLALGEVPWSDRARELGFASAVTALAVALSALLERWLPVASLALVFLCAVVVVAVRTRRTASVFAALLGFVAYNFFFTEPRMTLRIQGGHDVIAVFSFLIAALVCGHLAWRLRAQVVRLRTANEHAGELTALGRELASAVDERQVWNAGCARLASALDCESVLLVREPGGGPLRRTASHPAGLQLEDNDLAAADWVATHGQPAGRFTPTLSASPWWLVPLVVEDGCLGTVGLRFAEAMPGGLNDEQRRLAEAMIQQVALAADRTRLAASLEAARAEGETERLRTALLSSVSHDLRSPLTAVIGAASSLASYGGEMSRPDQKDLVELIRSEGERLDRYIQNLLDMTRLGSGPMKLERDWIGVDELLATAVGRLSKQFPAIEVRTRLESGLPLLFVHPALVEQALFNVLENAAKFSPAGAAIDVRAARSDGKLVVDVRDRGPGIPEEERRKVFDLFYRAARGDRTPRGSGLGLTIVRGLIGAHQGRVEALAGDDGVGTTIRITLPLPEPPRGGTFDDLT